MVLIDALVFQLNSNLTIDCRMNSREIVTETIFCTKSMTIIIVIQLKVSRSLMSNDIGSFTELPMLVERKSKQKPGSIFRFLYRNKLKKNLCDYLTCDLAKI